MREFDTAVAAVVNEDLEWIEWDIVERDAEGNEVRRQHCRAVREPSDGQIAFLMSHNSKHIAVGAKVAALLNFFDSTLDDETQQYVTNRLLDPHDKFGLPDVEGLLGALMEEWSGRPTESLPGSTPSQRTTGRTSTHPMAMSTSSDFPPTGS